MLLSTTISNIHTTNNNSWLLTNFVEEVDLIVITTVLVLLLIFGVLANLLIILSVLCSKDPKLFYYIFMSFSISDVISALISPLALYRITWGFDNWILSNGFCKIFWMFDLLVTLSKTSIVSVYVFYRFYGLFWPFKFHCLPLKQIKKVTFLLWIASSVTIAPPSFLWFGATDRSEIINSTPQWNLPSCSVVPDKMNEVKRAALILYGVFLYLPMLLMTVFSFIIFAMYVNKIRLRKKKFGITNYYNERRSATQHVVIVGLFLFFNIFQSVNRLSALNQTTINQSWWLFCSEILISNAFLCINPIVYYASSVYLCKDVDTFLLKMKKKLRRDSAF